MGSSRMNVRDFSEWDESDVRVRPHKKGSRPRTKDRPTFKEAIRGRVITVDRGRWSVVVDEGTEKERTLIAARAKELRRRALCGWASAPRFCAVAPTTPTRRSAWSWRMLSSW